ncbi:hypothetical protein AAFF_G00413420 [Aldrovandia affinis]|uniref:Uncharacterized protein n=1 Tax=Aldrovandia affinis TaxID=143900 RepID=A0AAD7SB66_9TELE|nr:hypothetical protein AAFF_G00413420 [Aldrovandia affinis]
MRPIDTESPTFPLGAEQVAYCLEFCAHWLEQCPLQQPSGAAGLVNSANALNTVPMAILSAFYRVITEQHSKRKRPP